MLDFLESLLVTTSTYSHQILQFNSLTPIHSFSKSSCRPRAATFVEETQNVILIGERGQILVFSLEKEMPVFQCVQNEPMTVCDCSRSFLFCGSKFGSIFAWNLYSGELWSIAKNAHIKAISQIKYHEQTGFLITASDDASVRVWNLMKLMDVRVDPDVVTTKAVVHEWSSHSLKVTSIYTGNTIVATGSLDRTVKIWDIGSGEEICSVSFPAAIQAIQMSPDEKTVFAGCSNGFIYEVSLYGTGFDVRYLDSNHVSAIVKPVTSLVGGRQQLVVEHRSKKSTQQEAFNFEEYKTLVQNQYSMCYVYQGHSNAVTSLCMSSDGCKLASASLDGTLIVWDIQSRQPIRTSKKEGGSTETQLTNVLTINVSQQGRQRKTTLKNTFKKFEAEDVGGEVPVQNYDIQGNWQRLWQDQYDEMMDSGVFGDSNQMNGGLSNINNMNVRKMIQTGRAPEPNPNLNLNNVLDEEVDS